MIALEVRKSLVGPDGAFDLQVNFGVPRGEFLVLYGVSGAGKTTLLRILAGLEEPDDGRIEVEGETWMDRKKGISVSPQKRSVGFVFQSYALFPTMTVRRNLEFAAGRRKDPRVDLFLKMVELEELQHRYPESLSGGQRQRVALARALIRQPKLLLLDEPLSALDHGMRRKLQDELLRLHQELGLTTVLVSHEHSEIVRLAHRLIYLRQGRVAFDGSPGELFRGGHDSLDGPLHGEVADITGQNNGGCVLTVLADLMAVSVPLEARHVKRIAACSSAPVQVTRKTKT